MNKNNLDHQISPKDLRKVGKLKSSHGIRGDIFFLVFSKDISWLKLNSKIYLSTSDSETSFKSVVVKKIKPHKDGAIISLEGVHSRNDSDLLLSQEVWVPAEIFISKNAENLYLVEIENFEVYDEALGHIGKIDGFSSNGIQDLLLVHKNHEEYEIPFVKEFILDINFSEKIIKMKLPEGLLDINKGDQDEN